MTGILLAAAVGLGMATGVPSPRFVDAGDGSFRFDTGILRGVIREGGKSDGFASMFHIPTDIEMAGKHGLMNYYRVFTAGKRYGDAARKRPSEARLLEDGSLEVRWPPAEDWPFELKATYRWVLPTVVEVETCARAERELEDFEVFLSSYFSEAFPVSSVCVRGEGGDAGKQVFMTAEPDAGLWQMFPRDDAVVGMIRDGRWAIPPSPVEWAIRPQIAAPIICRARADRPLLGLMMSDADGCYAVSTPHRGEKHFSAYLSLFGRDLRAGETARTRSRFAVSTEPDPATILRLWRAFQASGQSP